MPLLLEPLRENHRLAEFDCGVPSLNDWLVRRALKNQSNDSSRTYVLAESGRVIAYYCLAAGGLGHRDAPSVLKRNRPDPIPILIVGRLAIDRAYQNQGIGTELLQDAMRRAVHASSIAGIAALLVQALSEEARRFYISRGFIESPLQPMTLCLPLSTIAKALRE